MSAPSLANSRHIAVPMPITRLAPVTIAILFINRFIKLPPHGHAKQSAIGNVCSPNKKTNT